MPGAFVVSTAPSVVSPASSTQITPGPWQMRMGRNRPWKLYDSAGVLPSTRKMRGNARTVVVSNTTYTVLPEPRVSSTSVALGRLRMLPV